MRGSQFPQSPVHLQTGIIVDYGYPTPVDFALSDCTRTVRVTDCHPPLRTHLSVLSIQFSTRTHCSELVAAAGDSPIDVIQFWNHPRGGN